MASRPHEVTTVNIKHIGATMNAHVPAKEIAAVNDTTLGAVLARQRAAFLRDGPPSLAERKADLMKLRAAVLARRAELEAATNADFGHRAAAETAILELAPLVQGIDHLSRNLRRWMRPERRHVAAQFLPGRARIVYQPLGVVGVVSPWNYPVTLSLMPLATAIAAGNRVMLKPSELTPATTDVLAAMLAEIFPAEQVAVATGGPDVGAAFAALPFDHLVFTGSTAVGRAVMTAASKNLVPVTLELGGKSPVIVAQGFPLERAAASIAFGKLANGGQTCIAPDYALVHESEVEPFVQAFTQAAVALYPAGAASPDYTSIINDRHYDRLVALREDAKAKGARVIEIGAAKAAGRAHTLAPTVIVNATPDMAVMQEEIFGPILAVATYRDIDEAIAFVNARPRPLALYLFGSDTAVQRKVLERTTSGNVTVNDTLLHFAQDDLPFGGVGPSGMGAYHGVEGFRSLSHAKGVFEQSRWNLVSMLRPPFGRLAETVARLMLR